MNQPRQPAVRQYAGPLALLNFVVNETASFFRYFSRHVSTWKRNWINDGKRSNPLKIKAFSVCRYYTVTAFPRLPVDQHGRKPTDHQRTSGPWKNPDYSGNLWAFISKQQLWCRKEADRIADLHTCHTQRSWLHQQSVHCRVSQAGDLKNAIKMQFPEAEARKPRKIRLSGPPPTIRTPYVYNIIVKFLIVFQGFISP